MIQFFSFEGLVELWNPLTANLSLANSVDILLSPDQSDHVKKYLECSGMNPETVIQDLQKEIDQENVPSEETEEDGLVGRPGIIQIIHLVLKQNLEANRKYLRILLHSGWNDLDPISSLEHFQQLFGLFSKGTL